MALRWIRAGVVPALVAGLVACTASDPGQLRAQLLHPGHAPHTPSASPTATAGAPAAEQLPPIQALGAGPGRWASLSVPVHDAPDVTSRTVLVFTPPVADPSSLPVVYALHGEPGSAASICNPDTSAGLTAAFRAGVMPFILACPDGNPTVRNDPEWADSADGGTNLESFVTTGTVAVVEGTHPRNRRMRAIVGFSMGGYGAAMIALRNPSRYGQVASLAGYFHIDDPDKALGSEPDNQAAHDPTALVRVGPAFRWYLGEAADDNLQLTAHDSERYAARLRTQGASVTLSITPGGHSGTWFNSQLAPVTRFLAAGWALS